MNTGTPDQTIYTFETSDGTKLDLWTRDFGEAERYAMDNRLVMISNEYEWVDSDVESNWTARGECEGCDGSGIRDHADYGEIPPDGYHFIERCDVCEQYATDLAAASGAGYTLIQETLAGRVLVRDEPLNISSLEGL